jgi:hypothetical protein
LKTLKVAKVSDAVIRVMINPHPEIRAVDSARFSPPPIENSGLPEEVGVYVALNGKLSEVEPEIVGWQSGGVIKSKVTLGFDKGHVNGKIMKPTSQLEVPSPVVAAELSAPRESFHSNICPQIMQLAIPYEADAAKAAPKESACTSRISPQRSAVLA